MGDTMLQEYQILYSQPLSKWLIRRFAKENTFDRLTPKLTLKREGLYQSIFICFIQSVSAAGQPRTNCPAAGCFPDSPRFPAKHPLLFCNLNSLFSPALPPEAWPSPFNLCPLKTITLSSYTQCPSNPKQGSYQVGRTWFKNQGRSQVGITVCELQVWVSKLSAFNSTVVYKQ